MEHSFLLQTKRVFVLSDDSYDHSRWLEVETRGATSTTLDLSQACHPGRNSSLGAVNFPSEMLANAIASRGVVQVTVARGYALIRADERLASFEFRGGDDTYATKFTVLLEDLVRAVNDGAA